MTLYEGISLIISGINTISIFFLIAQLYQAKKQTEEMTNQTQQAYAQEKEMHEEQRRIKTVEVLNNWNNGIKKEVRLAEKIVGKLNQDQCTKLYDYVPFEVSKEIHDNLCQMCSKRGHKCSKCKPNRNGQYLISGTQLTELRGNVINYLNNLEIVAVAWKQAIVDKEELELQFAFLHVPGKKSALSIFREVAGGGNSYPALNDFYKQIEINSKKASIQKDVQ